MINMIPIIGWAISLLFSMSLSLPFWFIWNKIAPIYFYWLPEVYLTIPFWHCVGLFIVIPIIKKVLTPNFASTTVSNGGSN
jgi:hypothetical protein